MVTLVSETTTGFAASANSTVYVIESNIVVGNRGNAIELSGFDDVGLIVEGVVASDTQTGVVLIGERNQTVVGSSGTIFGAAYGIELSSVEGSVVNSGTNSSQGTAILVTASNTRIENYGLITTYGLYERAIEIQGDHAELTNSGDIVGSSAVWVVAESILINNSGVLSAVDFGIYAEGNEAEVYNTGEIMAAFQGVYFPAEFATLENSGVINGDL